jgi:hypothetical protein
MELDPTKCYFTTKHTKNKLKKKIFFALRAFRVLRHEKRFCARSV